MFHQAQYGFQKYHFCIVQFLLYVEPIYKLIESIEIIGIIYGDNEKALDNVNHSTLLTEKLKFGVFGIIKLLMNRSLIITWEYQNINII